MAEINAEIYKVDQSQVSTAQDPETEPSGASDPPSPHQDAAPSVEARVVTPFEIAADTVSVDLRDGILALIRELPEPWSKMGESSQSWAARCAEKLANRAVRQIVNIVAARDFPSIEATLKQGTIKSDAIEVKIALSRTDEHWPELLAASGSEVLILLADAGVFLKAQRPPVLDVDEPALPLEAAEPVGDAIGPLEIAAAPAEQVEPDAPDASEASEVARQYFRDLGKEAALRGETARNNPCPSGTPGRKSWAEGHRAGKFAAVALRSAEAAAANGEAKVPAE